MPMPIDLQVMFTKAQEHNQNLGRTSSVQQAFQSMMQEKALQESREAPEKVNKTDQYEGDFTKVQTGSGNTGGGQGGRSGEETEQKPGEHKPALKEEGTGLIIDILD